MSKANDLRRRPKLVIRIDWTTVEIAREQARLIDERIGHVHAATLHDPQRMQAMLRSAYLQGALDAREAEVVLRSVPAVVDSRGEAADPTGSAAEDRQG